jgi:hypothetical protein
MARGTWREALRDAPIQNASPYRRDLRFAPGGVLDGGEIRIGARGQLAGRLGADQKRGLVSRVGMNHWEEAAILETGNPAIGVRIVMRRVRGKVNGKHRTRTNRCIPRS